MVFEKLNSYNDLICDFTYIYFLCWWQNKTTNVVKNKENEHNESPDQNFSKYFCGLIKD